MISDTQHSNVFLETWPSEQMVIKVPINTTFTVSGVVDFVPAEKFPTLIVQILKNEEVWIAVSFPLKNQAISFDVSIPQMSANITVDVRYDWYEFLEEFSFEGGVIKVITPALPTDVVDLFDDLVPIGLLPGAERMALARLHRFE